MQHQDTVAAAAREHPSVTHKVGMHGSRAAAAGCGLVVQQQARPTAMTMMLAELSSLAMRTG
jgi:hypothetical protein